MRCQAADGHPTPVRSKRGAPLPRSSQKILAPKFSTKGMETPDDCRPRGTHWLLREESGAKGLFKQDQNHIGTKGDTRSQLQKPVTIGGFSYFACCRASVRAGIISKMSPTTP